MQQDTAKNFTGQLALMIESLPPGRAKALAVTKLEECYMWIGKAIRDEQIARNGSAELMEERKDEPLPKIPGPPKEIYNPKGKV